MAEVKKFLDQNGVSILWSKINTELGKKQEAIDAVASTANTNKEDITTMKGQIEALEAGTYDDTEIRGLISQNTTAITTLNGDAETTGSVANTANAAAAAKVAEIVAGADANFDTLKEIADWILNDTTGAAEMANSINAIEGQLAGITGTVADTIDDAIEAALMTEGENKYATATELGALDTRVDTLEQAGYQTAANVETLISTNVTGLTEEEINAAISAS